MDKHFRTLITDPLVIGASNKVEDLDVLPEKVGFWPLARLKTKDTGLERSLHWFSSVRGVRDLALGSHARGVSSLAIVG